MHRMDIIATALAGLILFALGLTGIQLRDDEPAEWLTAYNQAMNPPVKAP